MKNQEKTPVLMAGIPDHNAAIFHQLRFSVGDPTAVIRFSTADGTETSILILRDIEMRRARQAARVDQIACPADYTPEGGLSGDRETATAQAAAECLRRHGIQHVRADRSLPFIYADFARQIGVEVELDAELGILQRRAKDEQELAWLREAQQTTEGAMEMACRMVATATAKNDGELLVDGEPLTSERVRTAVDHWLMDRGYANVPAIIAGGPSGADCHELGMGILKTEQPVIIDIFPQNRATRYNGDCTRTVVHGKISDELNKMHLAVVDAKKAAIAATAPEVTGENVHAVTCEAIRKHGFKIGLPSEQDPDSYCAMPHGTGHGVGLEVHEPPLLDKKGPALVIGDVLTIEPGLYRRDLGGIRVEDMVAVTANGCDNFNQLQDGLDWS